MKCRGNFRYIELREREAGSFKNDKGERIDFPASYLLVLNEKTDKGTEQRQFKVALDNPIVEQLKGYNEYDKITIDFDLEIFSSSTRIIPVAVVSK